MQRNFALFLVLSFGVLLGWMALVAWLRPVGTLVIKPGEGVDAQGVKVVATGKANEKYSLDATQEKHRLSPGDYDLAIEGDATDVMLSRDQVTVEKDGKDTPGTLVTLVKRPARKEIAGGPQPRAAAPRAPEPDDAPPPIAAPPVAGAPAKIERKRLTIGSLAKDSPYRLLVMFDNAGAAIERIELASQRYFDMDDESGYLGHLALTDAPKGTGALVNIVGAGTPADGYGIKPGDTITSIGGEAVSAADEVSAMLKKTQPWQAVEIEVARGGAKLKLEVVLGNHPLQIVRPEIENRRLRKISPEPANRGANDPPSFLLTLTNADGQRIAAGDEELPGVDLRTAPWEIAERTADSVTFRRTLEKLGLRVSKRYTLARPPEGESENPDAKAYHLALRVTVERIGDAPRKVAYQLDGPTGMPTEGWWYARDGMRDYFIGLEQDGSTAYHKTRLGDIVHHPDDNEAVRVDGGTVGYQGINAQYFAAALLPQFDEPLSTRPVVVGDVMPKYEILTNLTTRLTTDVYALDAKKAKIEHEYLIFAGPKRPALLALYGLDPTVDYGWWAWAWIARFLQGILHAFYSVVGNYGLAILMLTVLVRLAMFPLSRKQVLGAMKMQELQPEMKRINEDYKKDLEGRNKALSALFRKHNYHPLSGCLPIFIQLPIFIGLYNSLWVDIELRQAPLIPGLRWCSNLAAPDMLYDWSSWMPSFVLHGGLFGFLPPAMGPYFNILPIFTIALMIVQQKLFTPPPTSEQAEMQQKIMKYMMLVLGLMFFKVASGLCLYFICSSLWGLAERKLMPKPAKTETAAATNVLPPARPPSNGAAAKAKAKRKQRGR